MCTKRLTVEARGVIFASCWCDTDLTGDNPLRCYINTSSTSVQGHRLQCTAPVIITGLSVDRSLQRCGRSVAPGHRDLHKLCVCVCVCVCAGIVYRHCLHSVEGSIQLTGVRPSVRPSVPFGRHTPLPRVCCCGPGTRIILQPGSAGPTAEHLPR